MLTYHVAYRLPGELGGMVVAEALDFPGVFSQGFDLQDARAMIASAMEDMADAYLARGGGLPRPKPGVDDSDASLVERMLLRIEVAPGRL